MRLERILETVLYYPSGQEDELARFHGEVLGLQSVAIRASKCRVGAGSGVLNLRFAGNFESSTS